MNTPLRFVLTLSKAYAIISRTLDGKLSAHGLGFKDFIILYYLNEAPGNKMRRIDLADMMGVTASGITRMLAPMEKIGLVSRESNERDARISYVVLAPGGKNLFDDALVTAGFVSEDMFSNPKAKKVEQLADAFEEIADNI
jgi:DNA-binding MarR family transcriptional regulator